VQVAAIFLLRHSFRDRASRKNSETLCSCVGIGASFDTSQQSGLVGAGMLTGFLARSRRTSFTSCRITITMENQMQ
jgi:hypothetical protein